MGQRSEFLRAAQQDPDPGTPKQDGQAPGPSVGGSAESRQRFHLPAARCLLPNIILGRPRASGGETERAAGLLRAQRSVLLFSHRDDDPVATTNLVLGSIGMIKATFTAQRDLGGTRATFEARPNLVSEDVQKVLMETAGTSPADIVGAVLAWRRLQRPQEPLLCSRWGSGTPAG